MFCKLKWPTCFLAANKDVKQSQLGLGILFFDFVYYLLVSLTISALISQLLVENILPQQKTQ